MPKKNTPAKKADAPKISLNSFESQIVFEGVRTHNLKHVDITLPKNKIITFTWVSGSGKSSLAFDTIYKEGQFRYIESLSSYLRQFFDLGERPDIDYCSGLSPAIAIEQNKKAGNSRSTVGTITEIDDYIRLLFAKLGDSYCYHCGESIKPQTIEQIMDELTQQYKNNKIYLLQESGHFNTKEDLNAFVKKNRSKVDKGKWFTRYLLVAKNTNEAKTNLEPIEYFYLETPNIPENYFPLDIFWIYDRVTIEDIKLPRLKEDIIKILWETAKFGVYIAETNSDEWTITSKEKSKKKKKDESTDALKITHKAGNTIRWFTDKMYCAACNVTYPEFTPQHFSPNRQEGACPNCHGIWEVLQVDIDKVIDAYSPYMKAILPWRDSLFGQLVLKKIAEKYSMDPDKLWKDLPERFQHVVINGDQELIRVNNNGKYTSLYYKWIEDILKDQYLKGLLTVDFQAMLDMKSCPECYGSKLKKESLYVFLTLEKKYLKGVLDEKDLFANKKQFDSERPFAVPMDDGLLKINIWDLQKIPLRKLVTFLDAYKTYAKKPKNLLERITNPLFDRVYTIEELWLWYLMLYRTVETLSGGEIQRLRLAKQLGNKLTGIIYVLDEPTIWLDHREIVKAITSIKRLKEMGNTIIVVEHNEEFIKASDWVVEVWPYAGDFWGEIIFNGSYEDFLKSKSLTADYITGKKKVKINFDHRPSNNMVHIRKANKYNLQDINVSLRLWSFTIITWPSGAGKTTLMYTTLFRFLNDKQKFVQSYIRLQLLKKWMSREEIITAPVIQREMYQHYENLALQDFYKDLGVDTITGHEEIKNTIYVDQTSIWKTPRSCPSTFIWVFDKIRTLYAGTSEAKYLGFSPSYFSFNSDRGACTACNGYGYKKVELQFLPDTYVPCDLCKWHRYKPEILGITWRGKTIAQILEMYVGDALKFFSEIDHIREELELMDKIWLGYLKMGQPAHTLSGGESQRLKLVKHLLKEYRGHTVYFLDEPTVGLHPHDIQKLLLVIKEFLNKGDTVLMIEHDRNILQFADDIIRLDDGKVVKE